MLLLKKFGVWPRYVGPVSKGHDMNPLFFYQRNHLINEVDDDARSRIFRDAHQALAHCQACDRIWLLATDRVCSTLQTIGSATAMTFVYLPYGYRPAANSPAGLPGFDGERLDPVLGGYHLGNGYRMFSPGLMRFYSPDSLSPFGEGGMNAYAYAKGDPVNLHDPTGHMPKRLPRSPKKPKRPTSLAVPGSSQSEKTERWTYSDDKAKHVQQLSPSEEETFQAFKQLIQNEGYHPKEAAKLIGDTNFKQLDKKTNLYQIRLSQKNRVTFVINDKNVEIRHVGGHT